MGVILFLTVLAKFPFREAKESDGFYKYIKNNQYDEYWALSKPFQEQKNMILSSEFTELVWSMFSYDPKKRPTISEIKNH